MFLALTFALLKLLATALQVVLLQGNSRQIPPTPFFRTLYVTGKATPALAVASVSLAAFLDRDWVLG